VIRRPAYEHSAARLTGVEAGPGSHKDYLPHPDAVRRTAEIAASKSRLGSADRFALQTTQTQIAFLRRKMTVNGLKPASKSKR